jgi:hypothetical protein
VGVAGLVHGDTLARSVGAFAATGTQVSTVLVHVRLAPLPPTIGPAAGNLWGGRIAARRITRSITGIDLGCDAIVRIPVPAS